MYSYNRIFLLLILLSSISLVKCYANDTKPPAKKSFTVKDLNRMELEKIKNISISANPLDSIVTQKNNLKDTITKIDLPYLNAIHAQKIKSDSNTIVAFSFSKIGISIISLSSENIKIDTTIKQSVDRNILSDTFVNNKKNTTNAASKNNITDSLYLSYLENKITADSIKNANKIWLDSLLQQPAVSKKMVLYPNDVIEIVMTGGGLFNGINPTISDKIIIYNSGLIQRTLKTKLQGEIFTEKKITKEQQHNLAQFIIDMDFFEMDNIYDCANKDYACIERINAEPYPIPLTLIVSIGGRVKRIYVALYAPNLESNWVNYPKKLTAIVNAIYDAVQ